MSRTGDFKVRPNRGRTELLTLKFGSSAPNSSVRCSAPNCSVRRRTEPNSEPKNQYKLFRMNAIGNKTKETTDNYTVQIRNLPSRPLRGESGQCPDLQNIVKQIRWVFEIPKCMGGPFLVQGGPNFQPSFSGPNFQPVTAKIVHECFYENVRSIFHGNSILDFLSCITSKWALFMRRLIDIKVPFHMHSNFW